MACQQNMLYSVHTGTLSLVHYVLTLLLLVLTWFTSLQVIGRGSATFVDCALESHHDHAAQQNQRTSGFRT